MSQMAVHMMSSKALHDQLAIIMGALTKAAVAEICEVVDEGYAVLQLEITRSHKENEDLKKKLHLIESIIVRGNGGKAAPAVEAADHRDLTQAEEAMAPGEASATAARELPDVVLIKDEDSDSNDNFEEGSTTCTDGGTGVAMAREGAAPLQFRSKKRSWTGSEDSGSQSDRKKTPEHHMLKTAASSVGKQKRVTSQYALDTAPDEPGCSSQLVSPADNDAAESVCSYTSQLEPDVQLVAQECPLAPSLSNAGRQAYFGGGHGSDALIDSQNNKAELDLSLTWTKQCKSQMAFAPFSQNENVDSEPFGLKLISVTGSTSTDCQLSESSNSAFEVDDMDMMNFAMYREQQQPGRPPHCNGQVGGAKGKRFVCNICSKTYATSQNLDVHMRIHTGERPFICGQCGKKFTQSAHLKSHLSVHSGERPYSCALCSKSFIVKYSLKLHMKKCHTAV